MEHSKVVGVDMGRYSEGTLDLAHPNNSVYIGWNIDRDLLETIRQDSGVNFVSPTAAGDGLMY